jgi:hypothetical protein
MLKAAVIGSFSAAAALTFAPLAAADDLTSTVDSEISSLNALFTAEADLAGDGSAVTTNSSGYDIVPLADAPDSGTTPTTLDYELYGLNPIANASSDPGSYNVFNGALTEFDDAYNSELYGLLNGNALIPKADLFGSPHEITTALLTGSDSGAATTFFDAGLTDLAGFFDIPSL